MKAESRRVRVLAGPGVLDELGKALDDLHADVAVPLMARRPWLDAWAAHLPRYRPLSISVESPTRLEAAALLAEGPGVVTQLVAMGHGPSDVAALAARDPLAADALASAISNHLLQRQQPWQLVVRHLPAGDPVAAALASRLPHAAISSGAVRPLLRLGTPRTMRAHVSRNHHQQVRRLQNRLRRDGFEPVVHHLHEPGDISAVLPEVLQVCRARDHAMGRRSVTDDPHSTEFLRRVVNTHAHRHEVGLTTLLIDDALVAYVLCFVDGRVFWMWNCRFQPEWSRYGVGRLAHDAALQHAIKEGCELYDWGRGEESYKSSLSNDQARSIDLRAWSGRLGALAGTAFLRAKAIAEHGERRGGAAARLVGTARDIVDKMRRP